MLKKIGGAVLFVIVEHGDDDRGRAKPSLGEEKVAAR
jgi:hypothetical protein